MLQSLVRFFLPVKMENTIVCEFFFYHSKFENWIFWLKIEERYADNVLLRIFTKKAINNQIKLKPALIYYHGGGYTLDLGSNMFIKCVFI